MPRRLRQNAIARWPAITSSDTRPAVSPWADARTRPPRRARASSSSNGGFHRATRRSPRGDPSSVTSATGTPHSADASRDGVPIVADVNRNVGSAPYNVHTRRSRRSKWATCVPKIPRNTCSSSSTTKRSRIRNVAQRA